jgi:hypothetical protein
VHINGIEIRFQYTLKAYIPTKLKNLFYPKFRSGKVAKKPSGFSITDQKHSSRGCAKGRQNHGAVMNVTNGKRKLSARTKFHVINILSAKNSIIALGFNLRLRDDRHVSHHETRDYPI